MLRVMYIGGGWGDSVNYTNDDHTRIYGFKRNLFEDGSALFDIANNRNKDTIPLYLITDIEFKEDPDDMFFANITLLGKVKNPLKDSPGDYPVNWYEPYIKPVLEEFETELKKCSIFNFKRKKFLKKAVRILQLMVSQ